MDAIAVILSAAGGLILILLAIIGWFFNRAATVLKEGFEKGLEGLASEVKGLRGDIGRYHDSEMETRGDLKAHIKQCEERHKAGDQKCEERYKLCSAQYSIQR